MEWVETTAKTVDAAKEAALDRLGVAADEAEFEILDEPKPGLFGRTRGEGRVRARVMPAHARPKQERRRRSSKSDKNAAATSEASSAESTTTSATKDSSADAYDVTDSGNTTESTTSIGGSNGRSERTPRGRRSNRTASNNDREKKMDNDDRQESTVPPDEVGAAAVTFMDGLVGAFGSTGSSELEVDGIELDVRVSGEELGLLVGPGGRTLNAIQDLARVSAQRRLGDHDTRLRIDVAGYRERRTAALQKFAHDVAESVRESGSARALEPMASADRKVIHDALNEEDGVGSRSEGDDPNRRIVVVPD